MPNTETPVTISLDHKAVPYKVFRHPRPIHSLEQAARERGQNPEQIIRTIVFRLKQGQYIIVLMPGEHRVSWSALRRYTGRTRITMATEQEVFEVTGYKLGTVSPLGLPVSMRILVDEAVLKQTEVSIGSGERGLAVILKPEDLLKAIEIYELGHFSE
jgi:Cys-tRNA(Pro)/Cys-tRNA(Cys) deacylase